METKKNLSNMFKGYINYTSDEYKRIWENSIIVVDTNILLNFYRYSKDTRKGMLKILNNLKPRLWLPYQVGKEYFNNKNNVIETSYNEYDKLNSKLKDLFSSAVQEVNVKKNSQLKSKSDITELLNQCIKKISEILEKEKEEKKPNFEKNDVEDKIIKLFDESIGNDFSPEEYINLREEGLRRIKDKIPPGYKDVEKEENGDYYIFYSMIKKAKESKKDIIFITDDVKEDWFNEINGEKHGGRYELLNEFYQETGRLLLIYTSDGFVKAYNKNINKDDEFNKKFVDELINTRQRDYMKEKSFIIHDNDFFHNKLDNYRNYLIHNREIDRNKLLEHLHYLLRHSNVPKHTKNRYMQYIEEIKNQKLSNDDKMMLSLINNLLFYDNEEKIEITFRLGELRRFCLSKLYSLQDNKNLIDAYRDINLYIKDYLNDPNKFNKEDTFDVYVQLNDLTAYIQLLIDTNDNSEEKRDVVVEKIKRITHLMRRDKQYN